MLMFDWLPGFDEQSAGVKDFYGCKYVTKAHLFFVKNYRMSNTADRRERSSAMNHIALAQNILGQGLRIGHGIVGGEEEEPAYIMDDAPVFHVRRNTPQSEPEFDRTKAFKWGEFTHPSLMMGMPDAPGMIKVYVSKVDDYYAMHLSAKLDSWMSGPSSPAIRLAAYTPHLPGDTKEKAGYRLFKSVVLTMDFVDPAEIPTNYVQDSPNWEDEWSPSERCLEVMRWVRGE
jgi:hypothetical protein